MTGVNIAKTFTKSAATLSRVRFLHPSQRELADADFRGPVKVTGSAGTGKTVVVMHRARRLADQGKRVLVTSFVTTLCKNIDHNLHILCTDSQRQRITVGTVHSQALRLAREVDPQLAPAEQDHISRLIERYQDFGEALFDKEFLLAEWTGVRGRSRVLRINYRTTEQIRRFADQILPESSDDLDGGMESRKGTRSLLHGPSPTVRGFTVPKDQEVFVVTQIGQLLQQGLLPREIAVFCRVGARLEPLQQALEAAGISVHTLGRDEDGAQPDGVHLGTMHRAKGLEYKVIFAYDCTEGVVPHAATLRRCKDPADYEAARARERQLLYVTLTRARDEAFVTWVGLPSPFLPEQNSSKAN